MHVRPTRPLRAIRVVLLLFASAPALARSALTVTGEADPCGQVCTFNLCVDDQRRVGTCTDPCQADVRFSFRSDVPPAKGSPKGPAKVRVRVGRTKLALLCRMSFSICFPRCAQDADCDDGVPTTRDVCLAGVGGRGACKHVCPDTL